MGVRCARVQVRRARAGSGLFRVRCARVHCGPLFIRSGPLLGRSPLLKTASANEKARAPLDDALRARDEDCIGFGF